jgi:flotillin
LSKQAEGFERLVASAGNDPKDAFMLLMAEKLPELIKTQVDAVKAIKIDKVTIWDSGNNNGKGGGNSTPDFITGLYKSVPPLQDLFNQAGMNLPDYLKGKTLDVEEEKVSSSAKTKTAKPDKKGDDIA